MPDTIRKTSRFSKSKWRWVVLPLLSALSIIAAMAATDAVFRRILGDDFFPNVFLPDAELGWRLLPNSDSVQIGLFSNANPDPKTWIRNRFRVRTNSLGFRDAESSPADDKKFKIVLLGDSVTFGYGENDDRIFASLIEKSLDKIRPVRVYNLGTPGYSSEQGLKLFRKSLAWTKPDLIVVGFHVNDTFQTLLPFSHPLSPFPAAPDRRLFGPSANLSEGVRFKLKIARFVGSTFSNSATLCWLYWRAATAAARGDGPKGNGVPRVSVEEYAENLEAFADYAAKNKIPIVFAIFAINKEEYVDAARRVAAERGAPILIDRDLFVGTRDEIASRPGYAELLREVEARFGADAIRRTPALLFTNDGAHPNPLGHKLVAEAMTAIMAPLIAPKAP